MHPHKLDGIIQFGDLPARVTPLAVQNIKEYVPALLKALDAAEATYDQPLAEELVTKLYEAMDLIARLPDRDPA